MRIGIIGHFGGKEKFTDGQTVKTVTLYDALLKNKINDGKIHKVDTYYIKTNPLVFIGQMLSCLFGDQKIIVLLSDNGRRVLFPILYIMTRYFHKEVYHDAIGGRLANEVEMYPKWKKYISSFEGNWMESNELVQKLHDVGVDNACYMPNFKTIPILKESELPQEAEKPYRFCIFSRVMKEKGVTDAIQAVCSLNEKAGYKAAVLDIYGPITQGYDEELQCELEKSNGACRYCGIAEPNKSVSILHNYYALLFPTQWKHEGIPGTIIDALSAGVPIIARRWQYCDEMITDRETGYVYDFDQPEKLREIMEYAITHKAETMSMRTQCLQSARKYSEPVVLQQICSKMKL